MKKTNTVTIKDKIIGGNNPILIQSMLKFSIKDTKRAIEEINNLEMAGCDIIRAAIPDEESALAIKEIVKNTNLPFVCDIHFDYRLAILAIKNGTHKLRINPGNIGDKKKVSEVVKYLKEYDIPVRIGINAGSLEKDLLEKYSSPTPLALMESAKRNVALFNELNYDNIVLSIKSSDVKTTIEANRLFSREFNYPLHLGVTEAGSDISGIVSSSVGLGSLLNDEIGDTIRVSLTGSSLDEVKIAKEILRSLNLRNEGVRVVSCPTCGRCKTDILSIVTKLKEETKHIKTPVSVAVMGCAVNGPGEAKEAKMGFACGETNAVFFKDGKIISSIDKKDIIKILLKELESYQ